MAENNVEKQHKCKECGQTFRTKKGLDLHMKNKHPKTDVKKSTSSKASQNKAKTGAKTSSVKKSTAKKPVDKKTQSKQSSKKAKPVKKENIKKQNKAEVSKVKKDSSKKKPVKVQSNKKLLYLALAGIGLIVVLVLVLMLLNNNSEVVDESNALVLINGRAVTQEDYDFYMKFVPAEYSMFLSEEDILDQIITQKLLYFEAEDQGFSVSEEELDEILSLSIMQSGMSEAEFNQVLGELNLTRDDFKSYLNDQLLVSKLLNKTIYSQIEVTDSEAENYYNLNKNSFLYFNASHILICYNDLETCSTNRTQEEALTLIADLYNQATPENFAGLAREYSDDSSAVNGGRLGLFGIGDMVDEFEEKVQSMQEGEISEAIETNFGYHIILLHNRIGDTFDEVKTQVVETIKQSQYQDASELYAKQLREQADIEYLHPEEDNVSSSSSSNLDNNQQEGSSLEGSCSQKHDLNNAVIFLHADWCSHCQSMVPIVENLETQGNLFYWANVDDANAMNVVTDCYKDLSSVPQFICSNNGEKLVGAQSSEELEDFVATCNA